MFFSLDVLLSLVLFILQFILQGEAWQETGHHWLGKTVGREFEEGLTFGTVTKWLPPDGVDNAM